MKTSFRHARAVVSACVALAGCALPNLARGDGPDTSATGLRCEYLVNPLGIDVKEPRLSWLVESPQRGQKQTAYQILVASDVGVLKEDKGDLWDSGKTASDETTAVVYAGAPLASHQRCYWKMKVWDRDGRPSAWSEPGLWSMGLLAASDWKAQWIGCDKVREAAVPDAPFGGAKWIWHAADKGAEKPKAHRLFLTALTLPEGEKIEKAELLVTADDAFKFTINGQLVASGDAASGGWKRPKTVDVAAKLKPGANTLRVEVENASPGPAGLLVKLTAAAGGKTVTLLSDGSWKSLADPGENWHNRDIDLDKLPAAEVVAAYGDAPWGKLKAAPLVLPPAALLRTEFRAARLVKHATLYATALGIFDLYLNGKRVTEDRFNPGWTDYTKRVYFRAYDVTGLVRPGDNALEAVLADGWFSGYVGYGHSRDLYGERPRFLGQLRLEYADGSTDVAASGPDWKASTGAIREADFLMGETYDARRAPRGWDEPKFDDAGWEKVDVGAAVTPLVQHHPGPPIRAFSELRAKTITEPKKDGVYVLDLGQNFAGVARLTVKGEPGQKITLRFAERLNSDGTVYTANLRGARATDTYICCGAGTETWEPRFTFHGFQYVEVAGLKHPPDQDTVVGVALSSDTPVAGQFACSDPMVERLHDNIYWTQRANFIDVPTDCPQRDERLGWTGDAQVYVRTATLNTDVQAFFTKWLVDLDDAQRSDGQFPMVVPLKVAGDDGGPAWADAGVICPWTIYDVYGDRRVLERSYPAMTRFIEFCRRRSTPDLLPPANFHCFGDWLSIKADTPHDVICTAYFARSTWLTARAAEALGRKDDAARYDDLFAKIKAAFNKAYVGPDGRIKGETQACYVLALAFDLLDADEQELAARRLVEDIEKRGHLSTGFIGTKDLMLVLAKVGRNDVAYRLLRNDTFPSWGFSIKQGATSIWERWDGWTPDKGFQDPGMNSFAHYSFGAVYQWMVENIGGIRSDGPGYKKIVIAPQPGGDLTQATVVYDSVRGRIRSSWKRDGDRFELSVTIPANTTASVVIPTAEGGRVTENGQPLEKVEGVQLVRRGEGGTVLAVEAGSYQFVAEAK